MLATIRNIGVARKGGGLTMSKQKKAPAVTEAINEAEFKRKYTNNKPFYQEICPGSMSYCYKKTGKNDLEARTRISSKVNNPLPLDECCSETRQGGYRS